MLIVMPNALGLADCSPLYPFLLDGYRKPFKLVITCLGV